MEFLWFPEIVTWFWVRKSIRIQEAGNIDKVSSSYIESALSDRVNFLFHSGMRKFLQITDAFYYVAMNSSFCLISFTTNIFKLYKEIFRFDLGYIERTELLSCREGLRADITLILSSIL